MKDYEDIVADDDSTTNDKEEVIETKSEQTSSKPNTQSNIKKLLSKKNELEKKVQDYEGKLSKFDEMQKELEEIKEMLAGQENDKDTNQFFEQNTFAKEFQADIVEASKKYNLPIEEATTLIIAKNKPDALLDEQNKARRYDNKPLVSGISAGVVEKDPMQMTDEEFYNYTNELAKNSKKFKQL